MAKFTKIGWSPWLRRERRIAGSMFGLVFCHEWIHWRQAVWEPKWNVTTKHTGETRKIRVWCKSSFISV